jgi:SNF2 family DNA or RNA helicase
MTPKLHAALKLISDVIEKPGSQLIVFSALRAPNDALARLLREASVRFELMDGRVSPTNRSSISRRFKEKAFPVLLCGQESCAEGHSWPQASTIIVLCEGWALDKWLQSISRVHRLISKEPVTIYSLQTQGSLDPYLARMRSEKLAAAGAVLDGNLFEEQGEEANSAELLKAAEQEFAGMAVDVTVDERELLAQWPPLREQLALAMARWNGRVSISSTSNESQKMDKQDEWVSELPLWRQAA